MINCINGGIENMINTNMPTRNILIKLVNENNGLIFNPRPSDKYVLAIGTKKKLKAYAAILTKVSKINNCI